MALDSNEQHPIGYAWLRHELALPVPPPATESYIVAGARRTETHGSRVVENYPRPYRPGDSPVSHLRFALRHEPIDLGVLIAALKAIDATDLEAWVRAEPTGGFSRRAWFFYECFSGKTLDLENVSVGNYVEALDPQRHIVAKRRNSSRHRVADNLLGGPGLCPTVRRTSRLTEAMDLQVDKEAARLIQHYDPLVHARAVNYLYTNETRSSFAIEGETPGATRAQRFIAALRTAANFDPNDKAALVGLQGKIVDHRYAASDWRTLQNFVGSTVSGFREEVHFICPRPKDVPELMQAWMALTERVVNEVDDPVVAAAVSAFAFVFIHPFEDGNGRIHRFLMHHVLAKRGFSPAESIFPVSAAILRNRHGYDQVLNTFAKPCLEFTKWNWTDKREIVVKNETADLYRYFDATGFAEYLYERVVETVRRDFKDELDFVAIFDQAFEGVREVVDMPDRKVSLFVRLCMQNSGRLSKNKRKEFIELNDAEIQAMELAIQKIMEEKRQQH